MYTFMCRRCGATELDVVHEYDNVTNVVLHAMCRCGRSKNGVAAECRRTGITRYREWGPLDDGHRWQYQGEEEIARVDEADTLTAHALSEACLDTASDSAWAVVDETTAVAEDSNDFFVYCGGCDREIEFGWSHPDQVGRIFPVECSDFNPWKSWPEPRYREAWAQRNWLRPIPHHAANEDAG